MAKKENNNRHEINKKVDGEKWEKAVDEAFKTRQKTAKVDGFRKGKVPRKIYEKNFGAETLYFDAANNILDATFLEVLKESELEPVAKPSVEINSLDKDGVEYKFTFVTKPEVKVKKYKGLNVKPKKVKVTNDEIEHELSHIVERYSELLNKEDGSVENGNIAIIDFEGFLDGVAFDGGKGENYSLEIGSNSFIPGFEDALVGMKVGEEKDINLTFPEEYHADNLAGKDVVFKVKVNEIKEKKKPEFDEDFFEDLGMDGIDTLDKLKDKIKESIKSQKEVEEENNYIETLLEEIAKNVEIDIPEEMVNDEIDDFIENYKSNFERQQMSLDTYLKAMGMTEEQFKSELEPEAYKNVLYRLMLEEISKQENIEITDEEVDKEIEEKAKKYGVSKEEYINGNGGINRYKSSLELRKLFELLKDYNK